MAEANNPQQPGDNDGASGADPMALARAMQGIAEQSQRLVADFLTRTQNGNDSNPDPLNIGNAFYEMTARLMSDPTKLVQAQMSLWQDYMILWHSSARRMMGQEAEPVIATVR